MIGGRWISLVTWAAFQPAKLPRTLNDLGVVIGVAGILTVGPALMVLGIGFRLGEMVWGAWLVIVLVRGSQHAAARKGVAFLQAGDVLRRAAGRRPSTGFRFLQTEREWMNVMDMDQEQSILRWGGLAGMLGGVILAITFVVVGTVVGDASTAADQVERFPEISATRTIENGLFHVVLILWVPHCIAHLLCSASRPSRRPEGCRGAPLR